MVSEGEGELAPNWSEGIISRTLTVVDGLNRKIDPQLFGVSAPY